MGILVPPCLTMVVLGSLVNISIVTLFLAGFVPAFILAGALIALIAWRARRQGWPVSGQYVGADLARASRRAVVPLGLPIILFGGIFSGATTVTEAALIAVVYALVAGVWMGGLKPVTVVGQLAQSGTVTATTLWVLGAASVFAWILVREWVPQFLGEWIVNVGAGRTAFLAITIVVFVLIGALLEGLPALLIFGPILFPISRAVGLDPVHYGVVIVAAMGIAFFLPPIGVGLSIAAGVGRVDLDDVEPELCAVFVGAARGPDARRGVPVDRSACCRVSCSDIAGDPRSQRPFEVRGKTHARSGSERHLKSGVKSTEVRSENALVVQAAGRGQRAAGPRASPDIKRSSLRTSPASRRAPELEARYERPGPPARFTPDLMRLSLRTSRAFHPGPPAPFTPDLPLLPRISRALHFGPPASTRTSRALHPGPPALSLRTSTSPC